MNQCRLRDYYCNGRNFIAYCPVPFLVPRVTAPAARLRHSVLIDLQHELEDTDMLVFTIFFGALIAMGSILAVIGFLSDEATNKARVNSD